MNLELLTHARSALRIFFKSARTAELLIKCQRFGKMHPQQTSAGMGSAITLRMLCAILLRMPRVMPSLDEWVGEEEHQCDDETVDRQGLHEGQGEEEHSAKIIGHLWLTGDAIDAAARGNALSDAGADGSKANGKTGTDCRERRDPFAA